MNPEETVLVVGMILAVPFSMGISYFILKAQEELIQYNREQEELKNKSKAKTETTPNES